MSFGRHIVWLNGRFFPILKTLKAYYQVDRLHFDFLFTSKYISINLKRQGRKLDFFETFLFQKSVCSAITASKKSVIKFRAPKNLKKYIISMSDTNGHKNVNTIMKSILKNCRGIWFFLSLLLRIWEFCYEFGIGSFFVT